MKKHIFLLFTIVTTLISCAKFDHEAILEQLRNHEERIKALEMQCRQLNSNVEALQAILKSLEQNDYITDITIITENGIEIGYCITFAKGTIVNIYHTHSGADAQAPKIGIRKASDGEYYWTSNGEWLTDDRGEMVPVVVSGELDGKYVTPLFRIADGKWYVSYDFGNTWRQIENPTNAEDSEDETEGETIFSSVDISEEEYVIFTLTDGTVLQVPRYQRSSYLSISLDKVTSDSAVFWGTVLKKTVDLKVTIYYDKNEKLTIYDNLGSICVNKFTDNSFDLKITGLEQGEVYYYFVETVADGKIYYSEICSFITKYEDDILPMLDIIFHADGSARDVSANGFTVDTYNGTSLLVWDNPSYEGKMARFCHKPGASISDGYYKFDYQNETQFKQSMADGYSLEAIVMLDAVTDGASEIKAFCSTENGGTGIMVTSSSQGKQLTFVTNVSADGTSNYIWTDTGIVPERGRYYHIIGVWDTDNGESRVYIDGELKKTVPASGSFNFPKKETCHWFCIGGDPGASSISTAWRGDVAMARVYDEALETEWVKNYYNRIKLNIPKGTYLPEKVMYMATCTIKPGEKYTIAGTGFKTGDELLIESLHGDYNAVCTCTSESSYTTAVLPEDLTDGRYKLFMRRESELYPIGIVDFTVADKTDALTIPKIIAHRGYHKNGVPENSIEALTMAQEQGFYGSEIDVWITTDGVLVCNHDATISGKQIQDCTYDEVKDLTLSNGEKLPTLAAMLDQLAASDATRMVIEFKSHSTTSRNNAAVDSALAMISNKNIGHMVDYLSYNYGICKRIASALPDAYVCYLNKGNKTPAGLYEDGIKCVAYSYNYLYSYPQLQQEAHDLEMKVYVWTVNNDNDLITWIGKRVDYIITDSPLRLMEMIETFCK